MREEYYKLNPDGSTQPCDLMEYARQIGRPNTRIARDKVGEHEISTVFLGVNHAFDNGPPLLFETMVFPECEELERYSTLEQAKKGHEAFLQRYTQEGGLK